MKSILVVLFLLGSFSFAHAEDSIGVAPSASPSPTPEQSNVTNPTSFLAHDRSEYTIRRHKFSFLIDAGTMKGDSSIRPGYKVEVASYFGNHVYFGADLGILSSGLAQSSNVGLLIGADLMSGKLLKGFDLNLGFLFPGTSNFTNSTQVLYIKPEVFVGLGVGDGWRIALDLAYQLVGQATDYSGFIFGVRFERKTEVLTRPVND